MPDPDVLVIGAGLAGLTAARALADAGRAIRLLDKGVGPGGRLATRRIGPATSTTEPSSSPCAATASRS